MLKPTATLVAIPQPLVERLQMLVARRLESTETGEQLYFATLEECCESLLDDVVEVYLDEYKERDDEDHVG